MNLITEPYLAQKERWPKTGRHILAQFDAEQVVVYQAYNPAIGHYAAAHGQFGGPFSLTRMSWIKPNFLWMMYRCGWAEKDNQETVLAVSLRRDAFDEILAQAVHSTYAADVYGSMADWKRALQTSSVRLQWDPDHNPQGHPIERRAIQLGLRGETLARYAQEWIVGIEDITDFVREQHEHVWGGELDRLMTPREEIYPVSEGIAARLGTAKPGGHPPASVTKPAFAAWEFALPGSSPAPHYWGGGVSFLTISGGIGMDVYVGGKQKISLHKSDFKAQGGEGSVYVKGGTAFKVYADPQKAIPHAKIQELAALSRPEIITPQEILLSAAQTPVGYTMPCVPDALPLCMTFNKAFRDRHRLTPDRALALVRQLQEGVAHVHARGLLIVDLNETNFLVDAALDRLYFIDVDSYQTPRFPATALMDSVRDRHCAAFSPLTDWFSFAIVSFQMFVGIHPYKGKHGKFKTLEERMQANVSALNPGVVVPAVCLPFGVIPSAYREWYRAVLDEGKRCPPPTDPHIVVLAAPTVARPAAGGSLFDIEELQAFGSDIVQFAHGLTVTQDGVMVGGRALLNPGVRIGIAPQNGHAVAAWVENGRLRLHDLHAGEALTCDIPAEDVMATEGRLYVKRGPSLLEIGFLTLPATTLVSAKIVASVMENATQLFEGAAFMNMLGACHATLLPSRGKAFQVRIPELDGCTIVDTKFQNGALMVIAEHKGCYDKLILRFASDYETYDVRRIADVPAANINFVALDTGVCLSVTENDELEVFSHRKDDPAMKVLADAVLQGDCRLFKNGAQALFGRGNTLFKFAMRKP